MLAEIKSKCIFHLTLTCTQMLHWSILFGFFFSFYKDWIMIYSKIDVTIFEMIIMGFACYGRVICTLSHEQIYMAVGLKYVYF